MSEVFGKNLVLELYHLNLALSFDDNDVASGGGTSPLADDSWRDFLIHSRNKEIECLI